MPVLRGRVWIISLFAFAAVLSGGPVKGQPAPRNNPAFVEDAARAAATAAGAIAVRHPAGILSVLVTGKAMEIWDTPLPMPIAQGKGQDKAEPVEPGILAGVEDRSKVQNARENYNEFLAYNYVLVLAHKTPEQALAKGARHDLTFAHLFEEPEKYRGQIVHIEGRLKRLRKFDAARIAAKEGVPVLYEGWVFDEALFYNPFCVIISEIPKSIEVAEKLDYEVAFDGYFFKRYRYPAGDGQREAPLLIGRTLTRQSAPAPARESPGPMLLNVFLAVLGVTAVLGIGLSLWFRRGDRRVRSQLDAARDAGFVDPNQMDDPATRND